MVYWDFFSHLNRANGVSEDGTRNDCNALSGRDALGSLRTSNPDDWNLVQVSKLEGSSYENDHPKQGGEFESRAAGFAAVSA